MLSLPNLKKRNYVYIIDDEGKEWFKSKGMEDVLEASENDPSAYPPFHAYGPSGIVKVSILS